MGRTILAAAIASTLLLPSLSHAQTSPSAGPATMRGTPGAPRGGSPGVSIRQNPPSQPGRPAPPPAGPLVPPAPPSALDPPVDVFRAGPRTYAPRYNRSRQRNQSYGYGGGSYITDPFGYISEPDSSSPRLDRYMSQGITGYPRDVELDSARAYRDEALASALQRSRTPGPPKTFYVIPGCYAGDVRPRAELLPSGCQLARLREVPPVVAPTR